MNAEKAQSGQTKVDLIAKNKDANGVIWYECGGKKYQIVHAPASTILDANGNIVCNAPANLTPYAPYPETKTFSESAKDFFVTNGNIFKFLFITFTFPFFAIRHAIQANSASKDQKEVVDANNAIYNNTLQQVAASLTLEKHKQAELEKQMTKNTEPYRDDQAVKIEDIMLSEKGKHKSYSNVTGDCIPIFILALQKITDDLKLACKALNDIQNPCEKYNADFNKLPNTNSHSNVSDKAKKAKQLFKKYNVYSGDGENVGALYTSI